MKLICTFLLLFALIPVAFNQNASPLPEYKLEKETLETHLRYLASDHLQGRYVGSVGGQLAANYIAALFGVYGLKPVPGSKDFFQNIPFDKVQPPQSCTLKLADSKYVQGENMVVFWGAKETIEAEGIFVGHGWTDSASGHDDYQGVDVKGKVVFVKPGIPGTENPFEMFQYGAKKRALAKAHGAVGVVELFRMNFPWRFFKQYFNKERMDVSEELTSDNNDIFYAFIQEGKPNSVMKMEEGELLPVAINNSGVKSEKIYSPNVVGLLEGIDPDLKEEYVLVSAHYDHVGVGKQGGAAVTPQDSIFNGARDNAMGVVALLAAVKSLSQNPPKRSVIFLACTGEEIGMVGSKYYADHPLVPLEKTVFNLNNDGAGYNTTEKFSVIGFSRTNVSGELLKAAEAFDLTIAKDPAPEQGLYERSDNISFAKKGIPAIDFAPGISAMDESLMKYYHQVSDNPETIDFDYLLKFSQAFSLTARLISDKKETPAWKPGDRYDIR
jgi:hypothetical protein